MVLQGHAEYVEKTQSTLSSAKDLLISTSYALDSAATRYDKSEDDAVVVINDLFKDLDPNANTPPMTVNTPKSGSGLTNPSTLLTDPESPLDNPTFGVIWKIMNWPDYLSLSYWGRQSLNWALQLMWPDLAGGDVFEYLSQQIGGDWNKIALAGNAFGKVGDYYVGLSQCVNDAGTDMFTGWPSGAGADAAGQFFAELTNAFAAQEEVFESLDTKYTDAAWASYHGCNLMLSALDAAIDAMIAAATAGGSLVTFVASFFDFGTTIPLAVVEAVVAVIEAFSSAWGWMMMAVQGTLSLGALLGAATQQIEFIPPLPEA